MSLTEEQIQAIRAQVVLDKQIDDAMCEIVQNLINERNGWIWTVQAFNIVKAFRKAGWTPPKEVPSGN
jgi:hypothetical protein